MTGSPSETLAREHLDLLWPAGLPEGSRVVVSSINGQGKTNPKFWPTLDLAAAYAVKIGARANTYIGMAAQPELSEGRGSAETALAIPGAWADLDVKKGAFKSKKAARQFVQSLPLKPSLIVDSGGGIQAVWLLREYREIEDKNDRKDVERSLKGWERFVQDEAMKHHSAKLDSVADLARIFRIAGTSNFKYDHPRPVKLLESSGPRHNLDDFEQFIPAGFDVNGSSPPIEVDMDAELPKEELKALKDNFELFRQSWDGKRADKPHWSANEYDLSVCRYAKEAGFTNGELAALVYARRLHAGDDTRKALRPDYIRMTIATVRDGWDEGSGEETGGGLARLSKRIGFVVERIEDQAGDKVLFGSRADGRKVVVRLPGASYVLNPRRVEEAVYDAADLTINLGKKSDWLKFTQIIADEAVRIEMPTDEQQTLSWVKRSMDKPIIDYRDPINQKRLAAIYGAERDDSSSVYETHPGYMCSWREGNQCVVGLDRFAAFLTENLHMKLSHKEIGKRLRAAGFDKKRLSVTYEGKITQKMVWLAPFGVLEDE